MSTESTESAPPDVSPPASAAQPEPPNDETVRKIYADSLKDGESLHSVFRVGRKAKITARSGKTLVQLTLADKTGEVEARIFDEVEALEPRFESGDFVLVRGQVISFHGKLQIKVTELEKLDPGPMDPAEFTPPPPPAPSQSPAGNDSRPPEPSRGMTALRELIDRVQDPFVKALLLAFLEDPAVARGLPVAPAAKGIHHAYRGGLLDHMISVMRLALRIAEHYPMLDRDLLLAGAFLHDIGKVSELSYEKGFDYTDEGRLVGHLVMTAQDIRQKASAIPGFPKALEHHLTHLVIAHHGQLEYGSPKLPVTLEAYVVHMIDSLDSRIASWLELMRKDPNERWTEVARHYERHLWKGRSPTVRNSSPVDGRVGGGSPSKRKNRDRKRDRSGPKASPEPAQSKPAASALPKELTFKPFNLLSTARTEGEESTS